MDEGGITICFTFFLFCHRGRHRKERAKGGKFSEARLENWDLGKSSSPDLTETKKKKVGKRKSLRWLRRVRSGLWIRRDDFTHTVNFYDSCSGFPEKRPRKITLPFVLKIVEYLFCYNLPDVNLFFCPRLRPKNPVLAQSGIPRMRKQLKQQKLSA